MSDEMVLVKKSDLEAAIAAMTETRRASIEGCNVGYIWNDPDGGSWTEDLYTSHGGLTKSIKTLEAAKESNEFIEILEDATLAIATVAYYNGRFRDKWWSDLMNAQGKIVRLIPLENVDQLVKKLFEKVL